MVDAGAGFFGPREALAAESQPMAAASPAMTVHDYARFAAATPCAPAQSAIWVQSWIAHIEADYAFVSASAAPAEPDGD